MSEHEAGYGKPPKQHQFKKGQSGNPKGRPKSSRNFKTDLAKELTERVTLREGGQLVPMRKQQAFAKSLVGNAIQGKPVAVRNLLEAIDWDRGAAYDQ